MLSDHLVQAVRQLGELFRRTALTGLSGGPLRPRRLRAASWLPGKLLERLLYGGMHLGPESRHVCLDRSFYLLVQCSGSTRQKRSSLTASRYGALDRAGSK